jgi:hypothetical protein
MIGSGRGPGGLGGSGGTGMGPGGSGSGWGTGGSGKGSGGGIGVARGAGSGRDAPLGSLTMAMARRYPPVTASTGGAARRPAASVATSRTMRATKNWATATPATVAAAAVSW